MFNIFKRTLWTNMAFLYLVGSEMFDLNAKKDWYKSLSTQMKVYIIYKQ